MDLIYDFVKRDVEAAGDNVRALEAQHNELGEVQELVAQKASLAAEIRANKTKVQDLNVCRHSPVLSFMCTDPYITSRYTEPAQGY